MVGGARPKKIASDQSIIGAFYLWVGGRRFAYPPYTFMGSYEVAKPELCRKWRCQAELGNEE
jgi:hypothetical protein